MKARIIETSNYHKYIDEYKIGRLLAKVLCSFNYNNEEIDSFFNAQKIEIISIINDKIKEALLYAKEKKQKVFIYGDYDCDGICSTTIMMTILKKLGIEGGYYIPNRFVDGYGLNLKYLKQAYEKGYKVLICVDNGVSAFEQIKWAKEKGMMVIVIDHHEITTQVDCDLLLHPSFLPFGYEGLCATGLVYLLADYLELLTDKEKIISCIATIVDMMELKGVNVSIVKEGLKLLENNKTSCISYLCEKSDYPIDEVVIGFKIGPKINAIGRLADKANPNNLVAFLLNENERDLAEYACSINKINELRKEMTQQQYKMIEKNIDLSKNYIIFQSNEIHEGLCGVLASKLVEKYHKLTIIFSNVNGVLKGSGRSVDNLDFFSFLLPLRNIFITFGGHKLALGLSLLEKDYDVLLEYFKVNCIYKFEKEIFYIETNLEELTIQNYNEILKYRPFGIGRKIPLFGLKSDYIVEYCFLKNENQLKWILGNEKNKIECISWGNNKGFKYYLGKSNLMFIGNIKENNFMGNVVLNLYIEQIIEL